MGNKNYKNRASKLRGDVAAKRSMANLDKTNSYLEKINCQLLSFVSSLAVPSCTARVEIHKGISFQFF
jgi:hypothetical protein